MLQLARGIVSARRSSVVLILDRPGLSSPIVAYSIWRKLRAAYTGPAIKVQRTNGDQLDIGFVDNYLDVATLLAFCGSGSGQVIRVYCQQGSGHDQTTTIGSAPFIVNAGVLLVSSTSKAEARFDGINDYWQSPNFTLPQPITIFGVFKPITWTANDTIWDGKNNVSMLFAQNSITPGHVIYAGTASPQKDFPLNVTHLATVVYNGAASTFRKDNDAETTHSIGTAAAGGVSIGARGGLSFFGNFAFQELIVYNTVKSLTDQTTARDDFNAEYGIWV